MNRRRYNDGRSRHPWLITFADLMIVVLVMFVLLYSYSETDTQKFHSVMSSFKNDSHFDRGSVPEGFEEGMTESENEEASETGKEEETIVSKEYEDLLAEMIERENRIKEIMDYVETYAAEHDLEQKMTVSPTGKGIEIVLPEVMLFPSGQANLIEEAMAFLDDMAPMLSEISNYIEVEGHTDNRPISTNRFPSNWDLSTARANEVIRYLVEEHGIQPERFTSVGYGEYRPIASNDTREGRSKNRRVVMMILNEYVEN